MLDSSVSMRWCLGDGKPSEGEYVAAVARALRTDSARVPAIWALEIANVLARGELRGEIPRERGTAFLKLLRDLRIETDHATAEQALTDAFDIVRVHRLTAYDAAYLELARRERLALATLDAALRKAAKRAGVELF